MAETNKWYDQAKNQYDPQYNAQLEALKQQLANNTNALNASKTGINQNFDYRVNNQNMNNKNSQNNFNSQMNKRGFGRSSVATTGLAEMDMINNRMVDGINMDRTNALSNVDTQIGALNQGYNDKILQMGSDREAYINNLARELEDRDWDKTFKQNQADIERRQYESDLLYKNKTAQEEMEFRKQQLAQEKALQDAKMKQELDMFNKQMAVQQAAASQRVYGNRNSDYKVDSGSQKLGDKLTFDTRREYTIASQNAMNASNLNPNEKYNEILSMYNEILYSGGDPSFLTSVLNQAKANSDKFSTPFNRNNSRPNNSRPNNESSYGSNTVTQTKKNFIPSVNRTILNNAIKRKK